jgi:hypothetical protein
VAIIIQPSASRTRFLSLRASSELLGYSYPSAKAD